MKPFFLATALLALVAAAWAFTPSEVAHDEPRPLNESAGEPPSNTIPWEGETLHGNETFVGAANVRSFAGNRHAMLWEAPPPGLRFTFNVTPRTPDTFPIRVVVDRDHEPVWESEAAVPPFSATMPVDEPGYFEPALFAETVAAGSFHVVWRSWVDAGAST